MISFNVLPFSIKEAALSYKALYNASPLWLLEILQLLLSWYCQNNNSS